jgi:cytochrome c oxidase subunit I+III
MEPGPPEPGSERTPEQRAQEERLHRTWEPPKGWRAPSEVNNSFVGTWYIVAVFAFFAFGGALALLMRTQLAVPGNDFVDAALFEQLFTMHGSVMMFLFAVPVFEAFAIMLLPPMIGARDMPFPRLSAYGFWCFIFGGVFFAGSIFFGVAPAGGWFMYPPLTTEFQGGIGPDIWLLGLSFVEIAGIAAACELIVGVLRCRAPGMRLSQMPLYAWYLLVVAGMVVFAFPPLIVGDLMFELQRAFDWPFFDASRGGDPVLWQHLFWIFGHPEVYIIFLPAVGITAMIVPTFARRPIVGYEWIVVSVAAVGLISFGLWAHHMYAVGLSQATLVFFSVASFLVAIPTGVQIFCFIATILVGRFVRSVPMLFVAGGLAIFVLGGLTGVMVALAPFDFQAHDSYFIVAHLHYVLIGGMLFPLLGGVYYYLPTATGKLLSERAGRWVFWLIFSGFNIAFLPMHVTGLAGMPRRVYTYPADIGLDALNAVSTAGAAIIAAGVLLWIGSLVHTLRKEPHAPRNPWRSGTLEWLPRLPNRPWGLRSIPHVTTRYPLWDNPELPKEVDAGLHYLPDAAEGRREQIVTSSVDARPLYCLRLPGPSFTALVAAAFTGGAFIASIWHAWWIAGACLAGAFAAILLWLWRDTAQVPEKPAKDVGRGLTLPLYGTGTDAVGWWGLLVAMLASTAAFASLVFAYLYYWSISPEFPQAGVTGPGIGWPALAAAMLVAGWIAINFARRIHSGGNRGGMRIGVAASTLLSLAGIAAMFQGPLEHGLDPRAFAYDATVWVIVIWLSLHAALAAAMGLYCLARSAFGHLTPAYDLDLRITVLFWHFLAATSVTGLALIALFPVMQ